MSPALHHPLADVLQPLHTRQSDLNSTLPTPPRRREAGRARRDAVPLAAHGDWAPAAGRPDPLALLRASNAGRDAALVPLRMQRMASSPFAFLRGAAVVMAADLATTPVSGVQVLIDGDAHFANFGLFGTADGEVLVDLDDFDEVMFGPWEWDLERLTASVEVAGREIGLGERDRARAVRGTAGGYCGAMHELAAVPVLTLWRRRTAVADLLAGVPSPWAPGEGVRKLLRKAEDKARASDNAALLTSMAPERPGGGWRFDGQPPLLTALEPAEREMVAQSLHDYLCRRCRPSGTSCCSAAASPRSRTASSAWAASACSSGS